MFDSKKIANFALFLLFGSISIHSAENSIDIVNEFSNHLTKWAKYQEQLQYQDHNYSPRIALNELLDIKRFRSDTKQITSLACKYRIPTSKTYDAKTFDDILVDAFGDGTDAYLTNIRFVPREERDPRYTDRTTVSCKFHFSGINPSSEECAFILSDDNKILKITPYSFKIDKKTGRRKMKIDLSDLDNDGERTWGIGYNYNKFFPIGLGGYVTNGHVMMGVDVGYAPKRPDISPYTTRKNEITDLCNYKISVGEYFPVFYATYSVGFFAKYVAICYGIGGVALKGDKITDYMRVQNNSNGSLQYETYQLHTSEIKKKFIMRPNIRGFIPCGKGYAITLSVSYLWAPKYKPLNSFDFGLGLHIPIDD